MMFSSSSSSGGGGTGGGNGGDGGGSSGMKKQQKRPKVPKRGPGVAELEKILREQEKSERGIINNSVNNTIINTRSNINNNNHNNSNSNVEGFSASHTCFPPPPPPPPLPPMPVAATPRPRPHHPPPSYHTPIAPRFDQLSAPPPLAPPASLYGYNVSTQHQGRNFLEQPLFPMNSSSSDGLSQSHDNHHHHLHHSANSSSRSFYSGSSDNHHLWSSYSALPQKRNCSSANQHSSSMMRQILGPSLPPPSSSSLQTSLPSHEPPSNQSSHFNGISRNLEEPKIVGMKRPHPSSSLENPLVPSSNLQVSPFYSNSISRPHKSSSTNDTHHNFTSSNNNDSFRDVKWGGPLGFSSRSKFGSEMSNGGSLGHNSNFSSFINGTSATTPPIPSPPMLMLQREFSNFQVPEERMENSYQKSISTSGGSDKQRHFYNFLEVKEVGMKGTSLGSNLNGCEVGMDGPDLTLKL